jgi:hypothetical protein
MNKYLQETKLLDYNNVSIQKLINERKWKKEVEFYKIQNIYNLVRDEIKFGYNIDDNIPASKVLKDGYGQCNTKGILFMALLRAVDVPCRLHGFTIDKKLQKGAMTYFVYKMAPVNIVHSWVEVFYQGTWYNLEGFIIDHKYLKELQKRFSNCTGSFCGYGVAVSDFKNPVIDWNVNDTYIQKEGINQDFGVFDDPDYFFAEHSQQMNLFKKFLYKKIRN